MARNAKSSIIFTKGVQIWHNDTLLYVHSNKIQTTAMILGVISQG